MESITLHVGTIQSSSGGIVQDTRGITETLYKAEDDRLVVHVEDWSRWQGEPTTEQLHEVTDADLRADGRFEQLGFEAGYQDALTLDQALESLHGPLTEAELFGEPD